MTPEQKEWIDSATYEQLLQRWRMSPIGESIFQGGAGKYYGTRMQQMRNADPAGHVAASKHIGWD